MKTYSATVHLSPDDVESIVREHFGLTSKGVKPESIINFKLEKRGGDRPGEMEFTVFAGIDVKTTAPFPLPKSEAKSLPTIR